MKTVITAINSKFIHSALAPWYLKAACSKECGHITVAEFTINESLDAILSGIYVHKPDVVAFSCYIWNIGMVLRLAEDIKKVINDVVIILGGPEVSYDPKDIMERCLFIDYILSGEGEVVFPELLLFLADKDSKPIRVEGVARRENGQVIFPGGFPLVRDLDSLPSPYTAGMLSGLKNRVAYYEASRGCPFSCSYCISSTFPGVRSFSLDRVFNEIVTLAESGVRQIKFVDRTFNCNRKRALDIFSFIIDKWGKAVGDTVNFHFEAAADLFDGEILQLLSLAPPGLFQFEIGIQSTNPETLSAVNRKSDLVKAFSNLKKIIRMGNIHVHLDLIAGLPFEDYETFKKSFNEVSSLLPHQLQLGFLKLLKGSGMRKQAPEHGYCFRSYPPYEILGNGYISFEELSELKLIEEVVERYYNSGRFRHTLNYVLGGEADTAFDFFHELMLFCSSSGSLQHSVSAREHYNVISDFFSVSSPSRFDKLNELLKLDFLSSDNTANLPARLNRTLKRGFKEACFDFLRDDNRIMRYLPQLAGLPAKEVYKKVHMEIFNHASEAKVLLFDYSSRDKVTGSYRYFDVTFHFREFLPI